MPKLIDYPRTSYAGAWELAEVVDDTGGKCEIETAARKLNRKVSGSFKAIIGSAVKFGLITSKRELLSTTTLYKRIKHAYDKKEELLFHREAFLTPPLFTQICRKFRLRELPVQMLDVMLIREFGVEEINAQGVAKAFVDGCRMVNLLDERNTMADIDASSGQMQARRELSSPVLSQHTFQPSKEVQSVSSNGTFDDSELHSPSTPGKEDRNSQAASKTPTIPKVYPARTTDSDAVANLFGLFSSEEENTPQVEAQGEDAKQDPESFADTNPSEQYARMPEAAISEHASKSATPATIQTQPLGYQVQISGPGLNSTLSILEEEDIIIAQALLEKIRRQLRAH